MLAAMVRRTLARASLVLLLGACARDPGSPTDPDPSGRVCTQIGCIGGLHIDLAHEGPWQPGSYSFALVVDGAPISCTGSLPLPACDAGPPLTCDVPGRVQIGASGCALPPDQHGFSDIRIISGPARVELTIARDGETLHEGVLTPTYVESQPNGPGCEPICRGAAARVAVP